MNCKQANKLPLYRLLIELGISCNKFNSKEAWFLSPFRKETKASLKIDRKLNLWYDHGGGFGGGVVDFIIKLNNCDTKEALKILRGSSESIVFSFQQQDKTKVKNENNKSEIVNITTIEDSTLIDYLSSRKINIKIANKYCKEVHYLNKTNSLNENEAPYVAISFKNDLGGFETRNKKFKGCLNIKAVSTIKNNSSTVNIFEGFSDFLSHLTLFPEKEDEDFIITNSTSMIEKVIPLIQNYKMVNLWFDNDISGMKAAEKIKLNLKNKFKDCSYLYKTFKDLNEFLIASKNLKSSNQFKR